MALRSRVPVGLPERRYCWGSSDPGVISGSNVTDDEAENNASKALDWQVEHDKDSAELFYSTYTAQLSSKRKGMEAEGKTWNYRDILAQFITMQGLRTFSWR